MEDGLKVVCGSVFESESHQASFGYTARPASPAKNVIPAKAGIHVTGCCARPTGDHTHENSEREVGSQAASRVPLERMRARNTHELIPTETAVVFTLPGERR